jgi:pimeloyl-ACP methyl ester carboxylesterase
VISSGSKSPTIDFVSRGARNPTIVFIPGSYSTASAWRGVWAHLSADWRLAAISLPGCGETTETRRPGDAGITHQLAALQVALARLGNCPVHLVGHSFGGTVALAAALAGTVDVASLMLFEANPFDLISDNGPLYAEARALAAAFKVALDASETDAAARIVDWWGGPGCFAAMPARVQDFCRSAAPANGLDWETDFDFQPDRTAIASLSCPVLLVRGADAIPAMVAMTDALGGLLPSARRAVVAGAGHFLTTTHPSECAKLIFEHVEKTEVVQAQRTGTML